LGYLLIENLLELLAPALHRRGAQLEAALHPDRGTERIAALGLGKPLVRPLLHAQQLTASRTQFLHRPYPQLLFAAQGALLGLELLASLSFSTLELLLKGK
jgi:hypothetical protein